MRKNSPLVQKSYAFAVKTSKFCLHVQRTRKEYVITKQLLKSGTSIGANIEEGTQAQSRADFICKFSIALKEAHETRFWLRILRDTGIATTNEVTALLSDVEEVVKMLSASIMIARSVVH